MKTQLIFMLFLFGNALVAQQSMTVSITMASVDGNSDQPAVGVSVNSPDANEVETGADGICKLKFPRKKAGEHVSISVGYVDGKGRPIKLITEQYVKQKQFLKKNPDDNQINLLVCRPEDYATIFSGFNSIVQAMFKGVPPDEINNHTLDTVSGRDQTVAIEGDKSRPDERESDKALVVKPIKDKDYNKPKDDIATTKERKLPAPSYENKYKPEKNKKDPKINQRTLDEEIYDVSDLEIDKLILDNKIDEAVKRHKAKALNYEKNSDFENAAMHYEEICKIYERSNSENELLINAYASAANAYFNGDQFDKARSYYKKGLQTVLYEYGPDNIRLSTFHANLANTYYAVKKYELAIDSYEDGIEVVKRNFGESSYMHLFPLHRIAICYQKMNKFEKAEKYYLKTLDIIETGENMSYSDINNTINNIIIFYENQKTKNALEEAIKYYELLDEWHDHFDGGHQLERAKLWMDMARTLVVIEKFDRSKTTALKAKNLFGKLEGTDGVNYKKAERLLIRIEMAKNAQQNR